MGSPSFVASSFPQQVLGRITLGALRTNDCKSLLLWSSSEDFKPRDIKARLGPRTLPTGLAGRLGPCPVNLSSGLQSRIAFSGPVHSKPKLRPNGPPSTTLPPNLHFFVPDPEIGDEEDEHESGHPDRSPSPRSRWRRPSARPSGRSHDIERYDKGRSFSPIPLDAPPRREFSPGPVDDRFKREFSHRLSRGRSRRGLSPELALNHPRKEFSPRFSIGSPRRSIDPEFHNLGHEQKHRRYSKYSVSPVRFSPELPPNIGVPSRSPPVWETSPGRQKFSLGLLEELSRPEYTGHIYSDGGDTLHDEAEKRSRSWSIAGPSRSYDNFQRGGASLSQLDELSGGGSSPRLELFTPRSHSRQRYNNTGPGSLSRASPKRNTASPGQRVLRRESINVCPRQGCDPIGYLVESSAVGVYSQVGQSSWRDDQSPQHWREIDREKQDLRIRDRSVDSLMPLHRRGVTPVHQEHRIITPVRRDSRSITPAHRDRRGITPVYRDRRSITPVHRDRRSITPVQRDRRSITPVHRDRRSISPHVRPNRRTISPGRQERRSISPGRRDYRRISPDRRSITPGRRSRRTITPDRRKRRSRDFRSVSRDRGRHSVTPSRRSRQASPYTIFKRDDTSLVEHMEKMKSYFKKYPSTHPEYTEEWTKFYKQRRQELLQQSIAIADYNLTPEWDIAWAAKVDDLAEAHLAHERKGLREKHGLRTEDPPVSAKSVEKAAANFDQTKKIMQFIVTAAATANKPKKDDVTNPRESPSHPSSFKFTVISTLKLLNELETHLDHLGPSISSLLYTAVNANITKSDPLSIFKDVANIDLVETAMQKIVLAMMKQNRDSDLDSSGSVCIQSVRWLLNEVFREHFAGINIIQTASETRSCSLNTIAQKVARQLLKSESQSADADTLHSVLQSITKLHELRPVQSIIDSIIKSVTISSMWSDANITNANSSSGLFLSPGTNPPPHRSSTLAPQGPSHNTLPSTSSQSNPPLNQPPPPLLPSQTSYPPPGPVPGPSTSYFAAHDIGSQQLQHRQPLATVPSHHYREGLHPLSENRARAPFTAPPPGYQSGFGINYPPPPSHYR